MLLSFEYVFDHRQMSSLAVDDYNRARAYLTDLANKNSVPVLNDVDEAVQCTVRRLRDKSHSSAATTTNGYFVGIG